MPGKFRRIPQQPAAACLQHLWRGRNSRLAIAWTGLAGDALAHFPP
jgi:hypothetical protein